MMVTAVAVQVFRCKHCDRPIADWDGERITISHSGNIFIEIPASRAVVKCHHVVFDRGRRVPCATINRVAFTDA